MKTYPKTLEEGLHEWRKHYSLIAHKHLVHGDEAGKEIEAWLTTFAEKIREGVVEELKK